MHSPISTNNGLCPWKFSYLGTLNWFPIFTPFFLLDFSIGLMSSEYKLNNIFVIHRSWTTTFVLTKPSSLIVGWQDALQTITKPTWFNKTTSKAFGTLVKKKLILEPSQKLWRCHCALNKANPIFFLQKTKQATMQQLIMTLNIRRKMISLWVPWQQML